ncbi:ATP-grasp domain-containing protein [Photobacterium sanguinicancri]|uniref:ATP-grasp domain-containing protein n=1 Tax=Photobacterium sanguinicancri TaxID=875932 RepID=UPI0026E20642|nr:hypothetical protein [Photobacterium sanguinicancri]MDO6499527.1 hypothetical protein [Photobacterium sanguinicancri]
MKIAICCYPGFELEKIIKACEYNSNDYAVINLLSPNWLEEIRGYDAYLIRPPCQYEEHKMIFDERVYFLSQVLEKKIYPSFNELYVYENKRNMATWLEYLEVPYPKTSVFALKEDALKFVENCSYPIVSKANIGSAGSAVEIIKSKKSAKRLVHKIFGYISPELALGNIPWGKKNNIPFPRLSRAQRHYVLFQEFLDVKVEWRIIRVGNSFFGHQKLIGNNGFASGSDLVGWVEPPKVLLEMVRKMTDKMDSTSMAVDIFETNDNKYFVNELQSIFGSYKPSQMYINDIPGRYLYDDELNKYDFEEGEFCQNSCWNLRIEVLKKEML